VSPPEHRTQLIPLSVYPVSFLHLQLPQVRFSNTQERKKAHSNKGSREIACSTPVDPFFRSVVNKSLEIFLLPFVIDFQVTALWSEYILLS
jgi:hypothetical protein